MYLVHCTGYSVFLTNRLFFLKYKNGINKKSLDISIDYYELFDSLEIIIVLLNTIYTSEIICRYIHEKPDP